MTEPVPDIQSGTGSGPSPMLRMEGIEKRFPGVKALDRVYLDLDRGEVLGLLGVNGAGKSTLMNVLGGVVQADAGKVSLHGREVSIGTPLQAQALGIAFVHQELSLFPDLDLAENICIADPPSRLGLASKAQMHKIARKALDEVGLEGLSTKTHARLLRTGEQQLVEIARCLAQSAELIVLDEATSSLSSREVATLFAIIERLRSRGVGIIFLSHRLDEVLRICDRITVLRDHRTIGTVRAADADHAKLVEMMLGQIVEHERDDVQSHPATSGSVILEVRDLEREPHLHGVTMSLHEGEILGVTGVLGSGRSELLRALFGLEQPEHGEILIDGELQHVKSPRDALDRGIAFVPEDRRLEGLVLEHSIRSNVVLATLSRCASRLGWMHRSAESRAAEAERERLAIATNSIERSVGTLSGGNQQKVVLGKFLLTEPRILLLDEPTRGVDVGAKEEIYAIVRRLAREGAAIVFVSSETDEIIRIADRVVVLKDGRIVGDVRATTTTEQQLLLLATGGNPDGV